MPKNLFILVIILMALPYLLLVWLLGEAIAILPKAFGDLFLNSFDSLITATWNSILQSVGTAAVSMILGGIMALGLLSLRPKLQKIAAILLCVPSLFPPLLILIVFLNLSQLVGFLHFFGNSGIIWVQGLMNAGLAAFVIQLCLVEKVLPYYASAQVAGASKWLFWKTSLPMIKGELSEMSFYFFALALTSFSIPLLLNDGFSANLEIYIFEKLRYGALASSSFSEETPGTGSMVLFAHAKLAFLIQLTLLAWIVLRSKQIRAKGFQLSSKIQPAVAGIKSFNAISIFYLAVFLIPLLWAAPQAVSQLFSNGDFISYLGGSAFYSLGISFTVALSVFCFVCILGFCLMEGVAVAKWFRFWIAPSAAFWGLIYFRFLENWPWTIYMAALVLLYFPFLYKLGLESSIHKLQQQIQVARLMGARRSLIFWKILFPQISNLVLILSWLAFVWSLSEFGLAQMILPANQTWAQMGYSLLSSYQIQEGLGVMFLILSVSIVTLVFLKGAYELFYRKVILSSW